MKESFFQPTSRDNEQARLTVLNVAYPFAPVSFDSTGGAEQIVAALDDVLERQGHRSIVVACAGSQTRGTLIATPNQPGIIDLSARQSAYQQQRAAIERALQESHIDLVHMHGIDFTAYLPPPGVPVLVTLHLPPSWYPPQAFALQRPRTWLHCVSASQELGCPPGALRWPRIENGVPTDKLAARSRKRTFAMALGRICPEKGYHIALDAARQAGMTLLLAGRVFPYPEHERYYVEEIIPRLDECRRDIGPIGFERKRRLLSAAQCLLAPSLAPETSSLVAMEALACGTPVIAFPSGELAQIVEHGRTGFLVHSVTEMAAALTAVRDLDPETCRQAARERFSADRMIAGYLRAYKALARTVPRAKPSLTA